MTWISFVLYLNTILILNVCFQFYLGGVSVPLVLNGLFLSPFPPARSGVDCFLSMADSLLFCFLSTVLMLSCVSRSEDILYPIVSSADMSSPLSIFYWPPSLHFLQLCNICLAQCEHQEEAFTCITNIYLENILSLTLKWFFMFVITQFGENFEDNKAFFSTRKLWHLMSRLFIL